MDSEASKHMTSNRKLFNQFSIYNTSPHVRIADGSLSKVMDWFHLTLNSVLYVPKLNCNLLSVSKLIKDLNCAVDFRSNACVFQDLHSGKMIGNAKGNVGLYFLEVQPFPINKASTAVSSSSYVNSVSNNGSIRVSSPSQDVMLWLYRLGHPNFMYLAKLFPSLFSNKTPSDFQCDICQFSKHSRTSFPNQIYKSTKSFSMVYSDVWGPSQTPNITNARWFVSFIIDHT